MKKALFVVTSHEDLGDTGRKTGWYLPEVSHVYFPVIEAGYEVDFASPNGGNAPMDPNGLDLEDPLNRRFMESQNILAKMGATLALRDIRPEEYEIIFFAGGHGTMWDFPGDTEINRITATLYEQGGIVAAICHGPAALVDVRLSDGKYLVDGKKVSSFTNAEENEAGLARVVPFLLEQRLRERGADFRGGKAWSDTVVVSGRLITGQNPQSSHRLARTLVEVANASL